MKVLLVKPYNLSDHIQPSLGLGYLASFIRDKHEVEILDCIKDGIKPQDFPKALKIHEPDIVGIQCYTYDLHNIKKMINLSKGHKGRIKTIIGGPQPSAAPEETMDFLGEALDYMFQGEAEIGFRMLIDKLAGKSGISLDDIPGLCRKENGRALINPRSFVDDIDSLGMPAWDLIKPQTYPEAQHGAFFRKFPIAPIITTRGCPFSCTFCAGNLISGKKMRKRSVPHIINEMRMLNARFGIMEFHIIDDNFTLDKAFAKGFLTALKKSGLKISWAVPNGIRVDTLDDEMLELMKETGLYLVSLGIESGSDDVLRRMKKSITTSSVKKAIKLIRKHRIDVAGFFILGFPGETKEDIERTIRFSCELDLIRANFFTYLPFPGTESYIELRESGQLKGVNNERFYFMNAAFVPRGLDKNTLKRLQRKAFLKFFMRPKILLYNIAQIKSFRHFKFLLRRFFRWMFIK
ncbi:MAG: radical SAM protein [Candidatus Omnitrophica bacterium]|nr:radical SAM protein [Candidatus Omnitrophota bacterium]